jgi:glucosamine--fructose-6-phosphate aminotransferase (isomerizing)
MADHPSIPSQGAGKAHWMRPDDGSDPFLGEIVEQPEALRRAARSLNEQVDALERIERSSLRGRTLLLTGMGSSFHACLAAASALGRRGILAVTANAAELLHFRREALTDVGLTVLISQSGQSVEVVRLAEELVQSAHRPRLVAITNGNDNPLVSMVDVALDTAAGEEVGPSTKSYAATFVSLAALVEALLGSPEAESGSDLVARVVSRAFRAADAADRILEAPETLAGELSEWLDGRRALTILGRGVAIGPAETSALVLKEAARFAAEALDAAEFRHGPLELASPDLAVVVLSIEDRTRRLDGRLAREIAGHGSAVMVVGNVGESANGVRNMTIGPLDPLLSCAVAVIPAQLLSWRLALAKGWNPGKFLLASKVTTRE